MAYFSEREGDLPPQTTDVPTKEFIAALVGYLNRLCDNGSFAGGWPTRCPDEGHPITGTNTAAFWQAALSFVHLQTQNPDNLVDEPNPIRVLNLIEFAHEHVGLAVQRAFHDYFGHDHLQFFPGAFQPEYRNDINNLLERYGLAFRLEPNGVVVRLVPPTFAEIVGVGFHTGDNILNDLLEDAVRRFKSPDPAVRREAVERLWDAFELLKTIEIPGDNTKAASADQLLGKASSKAEVKTLLEAEFKALTKVGNDFMIRHHETNKITIDTDVDFDYLFQRMFAVIWKVLKATGRV